LSPLATSVCACNPRMRTRPRHGVSRRAERLPCGQQPQLRKPGFKSETAAATQPAIALGSAEFCRLPQHQHRTSHVHVTRHTSQVTRHTSHVMRFKSPSVTTVITAGAFSHLPRSPQQLWQQGREVPPWLQTRQFSESISAFQHSAFKRGRAGRGGGRMGVRAGGGR
jgi:hypothetical protein